MKAKIYLWVFLCGVTACGPKGQHSNGQEPAPQDVMILNRIDTVFYDQYPVHLTGIQNVDIRPRVNGYLHQILFDEGDEVKKGQLLFVVDVPYYGHNKRNAEAEISIAQADLKAAEMEFNRLKPLVDKKIVSEYALESAKYQLDSKKAALKRAKANYENTQVDIGYTHLTSPVDGVIGTIPFKLGSLVTSDMASPMTVVSDVHQVHAYFSINEKVLLQLARGLKGGSIKEKLATLGKVELILPNGEKYDHPGRLETVSGIIDEQTGAATLRAVFENPDLMLRSGNSAVLLLPTHYSKALLIPKTSLFQIQGERFVHLLKDGQLTQRSVKVADVHDGNFQLIESGIDVGDTVIIDGNIRLTKETVLRPRIVPFQGLITKYQKID